MINEERMSVYVRLGIRLLYKGLKSRRMEKDKSKSRLYIETRESPLRHTLLVTIVPFIEY